jgi:hypothetical protein
MALFVGDPSAPTRFGTDVADTSDETGLFLKMFGGEVFAAFSEAVVTADKHFMREIQSGKSAQFPKTWKVDAAYHTAGQEMLGQDTDETERVISIDGLLVSHIGIYDLDEAMSHFDIRSRYTEELGRALARVFDTNVMRTIVKTARADSSLAGAASTTPFEDGKVILSAETLIAGTLAAAGAGSDWWQGLRVMRIDAADKNIPDNDLLYVAVPPATFDSIKYAQVADAAANPFIYANRDLSFGGQGSAGNDSVLMTDGIALIRSNLIPQANDTANSDVKAKYRADFSTTLGVGWHPDAVGTVKLIGMGLEQSRDTRRQEDFIVAKMAVGHGPVRNEGAYEFRDV